MGAALALLLAKIALLGPEGSPVLARVERNLADDEVVSSVAVSCTRAVIEEAAKALEGNTLICTDGDVVTVWRAELDGVRLVDAVPVAGTDDRSLEIVAARVTMSAKGQAPAETTIVANPAPPAEIVQPPPPRPSARVAPRLILSAGPTLFGSSDGGSLGFQVQGEIGLGRFIAVTPWVGIIPVPRHITDQPAGVGTAEYRPTLFGCGVNFPFFGPSTVLVPRLGAGYAMLWVHTWPDKVGPLGVANEGENVFSPVIYGTAALSLRASDAIRVMVEGMVGVAASEVDIRVAGTTAARWGVPIGTLGLRGEYVLP